MFIMKKLKVVYKQNAGTPGSARYFVDGKEAEASALNGLLLGVTGYNNEGIRSQSGVSCSFCRCNGVVVVIFPVPLPPVESASEWVKAIKDRCAMVNSAFVEKYPALSAKGEIDIPEMEDTVQLYARFVPVK